VEWDVITGVLPPVGQAAWEAEFAQYKATPEGALINVNMTVEGYKAIYYVEYFHRLIGRVAGLVYVLPLFYFLWRGIIPWKKSVPYLAIGLGFAFQGFLGWYMVASGLEDEPRVSQYRLAAHLMSALTLLALTFWVALDQRKWDQRPGTAPRAPRQIAPSLSRFRTPALWLMLIMVIQTTYGAFVAGLKAGHSSNTWPLMLGQWIPSGLFAKMEPWWLNLFASELTVHFIHRWFAFVVLALAGWMYYLARKQTGAEVMQKASLLVVILTVVQITLGVLTVWFNVAILAAITHQGSAMVLFLAILFLNYWLFVRRVPVQAAAKLAQPSLAR
jgi:cytochrome c oxidase assembly protein subunit 15